MMKGGARVRLDLDEGWCETLHNITVHQKRTDFDEGWCETLHYITIHQERTDFDEGWCETLHYITIHQKITDFDEGWCETLHYITIHQERTDFDEGWCETLHYITIHQERTDLDEGWCSFYAFCNNACSCVRSSMRFLKLWCQIALEWLHDVACRVLWGGSRSTKPCVFPCKVAAAGDERYLVCAAVAAAVVSVRELFLLCVLQRVVVPVCVVLCGS